MTVAGGVPLRSILSLAFPSLFGSHGISSFALYRALLPTMPFCLITGPYTKWLWTDTSETMSPNGLPHPVVKVLEVD